MLFRSVGEGNRDHAECDRGTEWTWPGHRAKEGELVDWAEVVRHRGEDRLGCCKTHGFEHIVLIGDSGGNQTGMKAVAASLNEKWSDIGTRLHFIPEYYDFGSVAKWLEEQGIEQTPEGLHDDFAMTAMMMSVDPDSVRTQQRIKADRFRINGVDLAPAERTIKWGRRIINFRADATVKSLQASIGKQ